MMPWTTPTRILLIALTSLALCLIGLAFWPMWSALIIVASAGVFMLGDVAAAAVAARRDKPWLALADRDRLEMESAIPTAEIVRLAEEKAVRDYGHLYEGDAIPIWEPAKEKPPKPKRAYMSVLVKGTECCERCWLPVADHPMPARMTRSSTELCRAAIDVYARRTEAKKQAKKKAACEVEITFDSDLAADLADLAGITSLAFVLGALIGLAERRRQ